MDPSDHFHKERLFHIYILTSALYKLESDSSKQVFLFIPPYLHEYTEAILFNQRDSSHWWDLTTMWVEHELSKINLPLMLNAIIKRALLGETEEALVLLLWGCGSL
jgi:hypothetical protein